MSLGRLFVSIGANTQEFQSAMTDMQSRLQNTGKRVSQVGDRMTKWVTGPIVGAGAAIGGLAMKTSSYGDELDKTSSKLGTSVEGLQDWRYWAEQNGVESGQLDRAMGRLNQRIGEAATEGGKYKEALNKLGVSVRDTNGDIRETDDVMRDTIESLMGIEDPAERSARAADIFGTSLARDLMPALEDGSMSIDEAVEKMDEHGRVTEEQAEASAEFQDALHDLKQSFMGVVHEIGQDLLPLIQEHLIPALQEHLVPAFRRLGEWVGNLIQWFAELDPTWQKVILGATGAAAAIGPFLSILGRVISIGSTVVGALGKLGAAKVALTGPIGIAVAAIAGIVAVIIHLWNTSETFRDAVLAIWERIKAGIQTAISVISDVINAVMAALRGDWQEAWGYIQSAVMTIWESIRDGIREIANALWEWISSWLSNVWEGMQETWRGIAETVREYAGKLYTWAKEQLQALWDWIQGIPGQAIDWGRSIITAIWDGISGFAGTMMSNVQSFFRSNVQEPVLNFVSNAVDWGRDLIQGIWDGIRGFGSTLASNIRSFIRGYISGPIKSFFGISSPSKLFGEYGESLAEGLARGIQGGERAVAQAAGSLMDSADADITAETAMRGVANGSGEISVYVDLDGKTIAKAVREPLAREIKLATGRVP